jgi:hypothetical protein
VLAGAKLTVIESKENLTPYELALKMKQEDIAAYIKLCLGTSFIFFFSYFFFLVGIIDLLKWLEELGMDRYFKLFVQEELFLGSLMKPLNQLGGTHSHQQIF